MYNQSSFSIQPRPEPQQAQAPGQYEKADHQQGRTKDGGPSCRVCEIESIPSAPSTPLVLHGDPHETTVLAVGIEDKDNLYRTLYDDCGADVQIWESCSQLSDNDLELVLENIREYMARHEESPDPNNSTPTWSSSASTAA